MSLLFVWRAQCAKRRSISLNEDFAAIIKATGRADVVRQLEFAAIGAFLRKHCDKRVMAAPHVAPRRRGFAFWNGHKAPFLNFLGGQIKQPDALVGLA